MLNASYNLKPRGVKAYIPEYPVGGAYECVNMIHEFLSIVRAVIGLSDLKMISFHRCEKAANRNITIIFYKAK